MPPRPTALMIPMVTVCRRPNGFPRASTTSPARALSLSANVIAGRFFSSIFNNATSVPGSAPTFFALYLRSSAPSPTMISSALATTWLAVRIYPSALTMTPEPRPSSVCLPCLCGSWPPKNSRNASSESGNGRLVFDTFWVVNTVTTVGAIFSMMGAKLVIAPCGACSGS